jgi:FtsX-like permease family
MPSTGRVNFTGSGEPEQIRGFLVTGNFFQTLGVTPLLGPGLAARDDQVFQRGGRAKSTRRCCSAQNSSPSGFGTMIPRVDDTWHFASEFFGFPRRELAVFLSLSEQMLTGSPNDPHYWRTIVGLVGDTRELLGESPRGTAYAPFRQSLEPWNFASYLVKTFLPVQVVGDAGRKAVMASDTDQPVSRIRPVSADMTATIAAQRFTTLIAAVFASVALILAVVGTFGVMSHVARGRAREIGVRMALGATRGDILRVVFGQASAVVLAATAVGLGLAAAFGTSIQALLYEVRPRDPWMMSMAALVLMSTALAASYIPIRRVLAQNPLQV